MMKILLNDKECRVQLFPFSKTRHVADFRIGILTIAEKWKLLVGKEHQVAYYENEEQDAVLIPANVIPTIDNFEQLINDAKKGQLSKESESIKYIHYPWNLFQSNDWAIRKDFELLTTGRTTQPIPPHVFVVNPSNVFIEEGATLLNCSLNASDGPIYIGKHAQVMEGAFIRGPFALGENSVVKMGATIYGATSIGPSCVVGGEIKNSILFEYSNKAHHGYLGDSVIGAWCNLGAGTTNSNVKNTGGSVHYSSQFDQSIIDIGIKGGLLMGDYSRSAINTSFNTATTVGVCCNIFEPGFPDKNIPDFTWGAERYDLSKALKDIANWKKMKNQLLNDQEINLLNALYSMK